MKITEDSTFIIAEAGINHNGDLDTAKELVREAANAGADAVKFQIWDAREVVSEPEQLEQFRAWEFERAEWAELKALADDVDIVFFASVFDEPSVDLLVDLGAPLIKIASGDMTHIPLLKHVSTKDLPVIMSTGMSTLGEIERAVKAVQPPTAELYLLECVSSYPVAIEELNLSAMQALRRAFDIPVGFSDHTEGIRAPIVAVAMGARIVEKHFTLDRSMEGPDHELSLEPNDFKAMVDGIRAIESGVGNGIKRPLNCEEEFKHFARRGLTARRDIEAGQTIAEVDVKVARPNEGIAPAHYDDVVGETAATSIPENEPIRWKDL